MIVKSPNSAADVIESRVKKSMHANGAAKKEKRVWHKGFRPVDINLTPTKWMFESREKIRRDNRSKTPRIMVVMSIRKSNHSAPISFLIG